MNADARIRRRKKKNRGRAAPTSTYIGLGTTLVVLIGRGDAIWEI